MKSYGVAGSRSPLFVEDRRERPAQAEGGQASGSLAKSYLTGNCSEATDVCALTTRIALPDRTGSTASSGAKPRLRRNPLVAI